MSDTKVASTVLARELADAGFKLLLQGVKRTAEPLLVRCEHNVISEVVSRDVKKFLLAELDTHPTCAPSARELVVSLTDAQIRRLADQLPVLSQAPLKDAELFVPFRDDPGEARFFFENGVVVVTADRVKLEPEGTFADRGYVWEHDIKPRTIVVAKPKEPGAFEQFCESAFRRRVRTNGKRWEDDFELDEVGAAHYRAFKGCLGYLLHSYRDPANPRAIIFVDAASDETQAQGGNGKSLAVRSLEHLRSVSSQDGKRFADSMTGGGGRFQFSNVGPDTKIVLIDDVRPNFQFEHLFNMLSGDVEVEQKGKNKTVIPHDRAPKFAITTNYVLPQSGVSFTRRQYLVEFGSYWSTALSEGEFISDAKHLGKRLFDTGFTPDDWNAFFNYLFGCVQQYLKEGVVVGPTESLTAKALRRELGDEFVDHFEDYFENYEQRNITPDKGEYLEDLLRAFTDAHPGSGLNSKSFQTRMMRLGRYCGWEYNAHKASKGDTPTNRRWRVSDSAVPPQKRDAVHFTRIAKGGVGAGATTPVTPATEDD